MIAYLKAASAAFAFLLAASPAQHAVPHTDCVDMQSALSVLHNRFHEEPIWSGQDQGQWFILTQTSDGKTWTLLLVHKNSDGSSVACVITTGENGQQEGQGTTL